MKKRLLAWLLALIVALGMAEAVGLTQLISPAQASSAQTETVLVAKSKKKKNKATPTAKPKKTPKPTATATPQPTQTPKPTKTPRPAATPTATPSGPIIEPQAIADYLFEHGELPPNFITKKEAQKLGWVTKAEARQMGNISLARDVSDVAPGCSIGGDRFGNYEGKLPTAKGRQYYECDCYYVSGDRSRYRIVYSNDGLVFYTEDHYNTFVQLYPSVQPTRAP